MHVSYMYETIPVFSSKDTLVKLWDLDTQHCFQTLVGHRSEVGPLVRRQRRGSLPQLWLQVWSLGLVAMETRLVTASSDRELRVFKIKTPVEKVSGYHGNY